MKKLNMRKLKLQINISVEGYSSSGINSELYISSGHRKDRSDNK
jgi:hypothetical protein